MVIVGGTFEVDPANRQRFLEERVEAMRRSRAETGCLEYVFGADPVDPGRVVLFEIWESQDALNGHLKALAEAGDDPGRTVTPKSSSISVYDVSGTRRMA